MTSSCKIIEDLLPLYYDNICSEESCQLVEEHLNQCEHCRTLLKEISSDTISLQNKPNVKPLQSIRSEWLKLRKKSLLKGLAAGICICLILFGSYIGLTQWCVANVATDKMDVTDVCQLSDGNIAFHLYIDDQYELSAVTYTVNDDGIMLITPMRTIIEDKRLKDMELGLYNGCYIVNITGNATDYQNAFSFTPDSQPKAVYLGTEEDHILIWQEGLVLPAASEELENRYMNEQDKIESPI